MPGYEELLTENQNKLVEIEKLTKMRLPSSFWEHPERREKPLHSYSICRYATTSSNSC